MTSAWNAENAVRATGITTTIVEGASFSVSASNGDILPGTHQGVYFQDTRFVSVWVLSVNGDVVEGLSAANPEPFRATFIGRAVQTMHHADTPLVVERLRQVGAGLREDITIRNYSRDAIDCSIALSVEADFADLFEVKGGTLTHEWSRQVETTRTGLRIQSEWGGHRRGLDVLAADAKVDGNVLYYDLIIPGHGSWETTIVATPQIDGKIVESGFSSRLPVALTAGAKRFREWGAAVPVPFSSDPGLTRTLERSQIDLGALRIANPKTPERQVVAAGAPWFMALFGRDSLLTSYMALAVDPGLALGTLQTLADHQGKEVNPITEEQPGRILHEVRLGVSAGLSLGGESVYYGSVDATPLFVTVLGEARRWGQDADSIRALLPAADRALDWVRQYGDSDGDGFVEYERLNPDGLLNQGWKDSWDGINFADGTIAVPPIALCEVQGYVYSAYLARAYLARDFGDDATAGLWESRAAELKAEFNERFWMPDRGCFAIGLDRDKKQIDACASNIGHCLWSGIVEEEKARSIADELISERMFSGWGVRTLAKNMGAFNPVSYHNGSIWPHDNAIIVAGLMRYGFRDEATRIALAILDAAEHFDGRLPELFCGFARDEHPQPVPYPTSCSPQAWASAAPIQLVRSLTGFNPDLPRKEVFLAPAFPRDFGKLTVTNLPLAGSRLTIDVHDNWATVTGLPPEVTVRHLGRGET